MVPSERFPTKLLSTDSLQCGSAPWATKLSVQRNSNHTTTSCHMARAWVHNQQSTIMHTSVNLHFVFLYPRDKYVYIENHVAGGAVYAM